MAGGDSYKEFDNSSIVSSAATQDTVKIGRVRLRKRDIILGGIALLALLLVLILAIVLAVEVARNNDDDDDDKRAPENQSSGQTGSGSETQNHLCISAPCLKTAHYQKSNMDESFQPCEDFYSFACGHYDENNPQTPLLPDVTPARQIQLENFYKLIDLLTFPVEKYTQHSYERKLKHLISSCTNHFDKMDLRGYPLISKVLQPWGSVSFLDENFDPANFDLHAQLKKTHIDFWTAAFFTVNVVTDQENWNKKVVQLDYGGLGLSYRYYINPNVADQAKAIYKDYITHVLTLLSGDAGLQPNMSKIDTFVEDVVTTEDYLASIIYNTPVLANPHQEAVRMSLGGLTSLANNSIDFIDYMKYAFNEYPGLFNEKTTVAVKRSGYFHYLGDYIATLTATDYGKRQLSNYLVWTLINRFSHDLSWDYIHAKRKLNYFLYGHKDDSSGFSYCFSTAEDSMPDAMDAVFIKNFVKNENKEEADKILEYIRQEMLKGIDSLPWMTAGDKRTASKKVRESLYKIGYADYMVDEDYMDMLYYPVDVIDSDYFGNILNLNKVYRATYNRQIGNQNSRTMWVYHIFDPVVEYWNPWHELIATAAIFQNPFFSHNGPAYYNFGSVGSMIAKHLIHAVDEYGNSFRLDGEHYGNWWANATTSRYQEIRKCATDVQRGTALGNFFEPFSQMTVTPNISNYASDYVPELLSDASGLRLAFKAYKARESTRGKEQMPAGFPSRSVDQMFFIAFAQAACQNSPDLSKLLKLDQNQYPSKARINLAVSQVPEFAQAFNCRAGQPMRPAKTCSLF